MTSTGNRLHALDYIVFAILLLVSAAVGPIYMWINRNKTQTTESYFVGNRAMQFIPIAASLFASFWSAIALIGLPAEMYTGGGFFFISAFGQVVGIIIGAFLVVPMMYNLRLISTYEYLELRFRSKIVRYTGTILGVITYMLALAVTAYAPCIALAGVTPIPAWASITVIGIVTLIYTVLGGIEVVVIVDSIQSLVMFVGVVVAVAVGYSRIDGGIVGAFNVAEKSGRLDFWDMNPDLRRTYSFYPMILCPIIFSAGFHATSQAAVQRYSAVPNLKQAILYVTTQELIVLFIYRFSFFVERFWQWLLKSWCSSLFYFYLRSLCKCETISLLYFH